MKYGHWQFFLIYSITTFKYKKKKQPKKKTTLFTFLSNGRYEMVMWCIHPQNKKAGTKTIPEQEQHRV